VAIKTMGDIIAKNPNANSFGVGRSIMFFF
jgi:hypothetical protein